MKHSGIKHSSQKELHIIWSVLLDLGHFIQVGNKQLGSLDVVVSEK